MSIVRKVLNLIGFKTKVIELEIAFHKDANQFGTHGTIRASHRAHRLENASVRFVFIGTAVPPPLTPVVFNYIWESARAAGYIPTELMTYGRVVEVSTSHSTQSLVSPERRRVESMHSIVGAHQ